MSRKNVYFQGFLLVEICMSLMILGCIGSLLSYYVSTVVCTSLHIERSVEALFLARSCIEEYKAFKRISPLKASSLYTLHYSFETVPDFQAFHMLVVTVLWKGSLSQETVCLRTLVIR